MDRELSRRTLVVTWLTRGTLHLVRSQDYWWLQPLTTPQLATGNARRLAQEVVSPDQADRAVTAIETAIAANGPRSRSQLRDIVASADVPVAGQALVHILMLSAIRGLTVRGPMVGANRPLSSSGTGWGALPRAARWSAVLRCPCWPDAS